MTNVQPMHGLEVLDIAGCLHRGLGCDLAAEGSMIDYFLGLLSFQEKK